MHQMLKKAFVDDKAHCTQLQYVTSAEILEKWENAYRVYKWCAIAKHHKGSVPYANCSQNDKDHNRTRDIAACRDLRLKRVFRVVQRALRQITSFYTRLTV